VSQRAGSENWRPPLKSNSDGLSADKRVGADRILKPVRRIDHAILKAAGVDKGEVEADVVAYGEPEIPSRFEIHDAIFQNQRLSGQTVGATQTKGKGKIPPGCLIVTDLNSRPGDVALRPITAKGPRKIPDDAVSGHFKTAALTLPCADFVIIYD